MKATTTAAATPLTSWKEENLRPDRAGRAAAAGTVSGRCNVLVMIEHHNARGGVHTDPHLPTWDQFRIVVRPHPDAGLADPDHVLGAGAGEDGVGDLPGPDVLTGTLDGVDPPAVGAAGHDPGAVRGRPGTGVGDPHRPDGGRHLVGVAAGRGHRDQVGGADELGDVAVAG